MGNLKLLHSHRAQLEDDEIKAIALRDRRTAMDIIVRKYGDRLLKHATYILKSVDRAVDVTQEVFIKAMRETRFFLPDFKMKAWLFRVTSNLCFNQVRDRKRRTGLLERHPRPRSVEANQDDLVFADERQKAILLAMERLSSDHAEILRLRYYSDLSYKEIADALNIKLGTVMSRLSRARGKLMEALDDPSVVSM
ncbi:MAG: RNA polymerase sigma factor [Myxococcota bacterium]